MTIGTTVTLTHTSGVLVLGLALPAATHLAGETVLTWLGMASGLIVTAIGLWLLHSAVLNRPAHRRHHHHGHTHGHSHDGSSHEPQPRLPARKPPHEGAEPEGSGSVAVLTQTHDRHPHHDLHSDPPMRQPGRTTRTGLIGIGIADGLVPSPSALVVLLGAVALGRTAFGVLLIVAYGLGMAGTLALAGLVLVRLRDHIATGIHATSATRWALLKRLARYGPVATSTLVMLVGIGLTARAAAGSW